jgi:hypothetical protein
MCGVRCAVTSKRYAVTIATKAQIVLSAASVAFDLEFIILGMCVSHRFADGEHLPPRALEAERGAAAHHLQGNIIFIKHALFSLSREGEWIVFAVKAISRKPLRFLHATI